MPQLLAETQSLAREIGNLRHLVSCEQQVQALALPLSLSEKEVADNQARLQALQKELSEKTKLLETKQQELKRLGIVDPPEPHRFWTWLAPNPTVSRRLPLYKIDPSLQVVEIDPLAGGFPKIAHGGLVGAMLTDVLACAFHNGEIPERSRISVRLEGRVEPGKLYPIPLDTGWQLHEGQEPFVEIASPDGEGKSLAKLTWEPLQEEQPVLPLPPWFLQLKEEGQFSCLKNCVAFGEENPAGLHLKARYLRGEDKKAAYIWTILNKETGKGLMEQLMAIDELAWWIGRVIAGKRGVTVKYDYQRWRTPASEEVLMVVAVNTGKRSKVPVYVMNSFGDLLAQSHVVYMPNVDAATAGLEEGIEHLDEIVKILTGQTA